ncbi:MAG: hypothetical protein NC201_04095 [Prevotella sp.]|nr:hypothetical protein [Bacteroides sp.]MCM1366410.1 hypothetical protein [Prevotella sp.]
MRKYIALALCFGAVASLSAQKTAVDAAKKLSGKPDQISEARTLINSAMQDPSTANDANTYYIAGKIEFDAFDKLNTKLQTSKDANVDQGAMGMNLLNGYKYFIKASELDQLPNEKGQVKPKFSGNISGTFTKRVGDYWNSGAYFYEKQQYNDAYEAFYDCGDIATKYPTTMNDSTIALAFKNAGLMAYSANEIEKAADSFKRARLTNAADAEVYTYEIACWQTKAQRDTTAIKQAEEAIYEVAQQGLEHFGTSPLFFLSNLVSYKVDKKAYPEAIAIVEGEIAKNPENGNLYGLLAYVEDRAGNEAKAEELYRKVLDTESSDFDNLKNAAIFFYKKGTEAYNKIEGNSAEARAAKTAVKENYFIPASKAGERARKLKPDDGQLNSIIDNVDYAIATYF